MMMGGSQFYFPVETSVKRAYVQFYGALSAASCGERGLLALNSCARKRIHRGVGLRIVIDWACKFCNGCAKHHQEAAAEAALTVGSALYERYTYIGATLRLYNGRGTKEDLQRARRMKAAAVRKLAGLGYTVHVQDDRGGVTVVEPKRGWLPSPLCCFSIHTSEGRFIV